MLAWRSRELDAAFEAAWPCLRTAAWFSTVSGVLVLAPAAYMLEVYERVVTSRSGTTLAMLTLLVLVVTAGMELLDWARLRLAQHAGLQLERRLRARTLAAMFQVRVRQQAPARAQALSDLRTLRDFAASAPVLAAMESPAILLFLALLFAIQPVLGVAALVGAGVQVVLAWRNEVATRAPALEGEQASAEAGRLAAGMLRNAQVVAALGLRAQVERRWSALRRTALERQSRAASAAGRYRAESRFLQVALGSMLLGLGAWLVLRDRMPQGAGLVVVASILGARVLQPLAVAIAQWRTVLEARAAWHRLSQLLQAAPARPPAMPLPAPRGLLQVDQIVAAAPGAALPYLRGVQFALQPGEVLVVVGPSGAGKTSLARVLVGLWPCRSGAVRLDGADVFAWDKEELGPWIGYLPQEVGLFEGTLAENIARFAAPDPAKVEAAARAAGMHEAIQALPLQYGTPVGPDGTRLSGGHRQRVGLARALYGNPALVVLDEPNANLDEAGDAALAAAIVAGKARGTTFVVITQRGGVLGLADKVLVLDDGQVQHFGPRDAVMAALQGGAAAAPPQRRRTATASFALHK